jgi:hypothetical protein
MNITNLVTVNHVVGLTHTCNAHMCTHAHTYTVSLSKYIKRNQIHAYLIFSIIQYSNHSHNLVLFGAECKLGFADSFPQFVVYVPMKLHHMVARLAWVKQKEIGFTIL